MRRSWPALLLVLVPACSEPSTSDRSSQGLAATAFDPAVSFASFSTFATVDAVTLTTSLITDGGTLPQDQSQQILSQIASNLSARGYRQVGRDQSPDLGVNATFSFQVSVVSQVAPGAWWGAPGYPSPSVWGYPQGGYASVYAYSSQAFKNATLIIELVDLRDVATFNERDAGAEVLSSVDAGNVTRLEVVWGSFLHGYLAVGEGKLGPAVLPAIDQAFAQSPYLHK